MIAQARGAQLRVRLPSPPLSISRIDAIMQTTLHEILPLEIVEFILALCDPVDVAAFSQTSSLYRSLVYETEDEHLWRSLYLSQPFDDPRNCVDFLGERRKNVKWIEELQKIIRARNLLKDTERDDFPPDERCEVLETLWHMASHVVPTNRAFSEEISDNHIWVAATLRGGKFLHAPGLTVEEKQLGAK